MNGKRILLLIAPVLLLGTSLFAAKEQEYFNLFLVTQASRMNADVDIIFSGPVQVQVKDPSGRMTSSLKREIPGCKIVSGDFSPYPGDGIVDHAITIPHGAENGGYSVSINPNSDAKPGDRFSLEIYVKGKLVKQVGNLQVKDIPNEPYLVEVKNLPPEIIGLDVSFFLVGEKKQVDIFARDYEKNKFKAIFKLKKAPPGMTMQIKEGTPWASLYWTPTMNDLGIHDVVLTAEDEAGGVTEAQRTYRVILSSVQGFTARGEPGRVILNWAPLEGATSYNIYARELDEPVATNIKGTEYVDTQIQPGEERTYSVYGIDRLGNTSVCSGFILVHGR